jgi:hypothetical protein
MDLFDKEEVTAPSMEAAIAEAVKPATPTPTPTPAPAPVKSGAECTRDTRGEADCAVNDCENCN